MLQALYQPILPARCLAQVPALYHLVNRLLFRLLHRQRYRARHPVLALQVLLALLPVTNQLTTQVPYPPSLQVRPPVGYRAPDHQEDRVQSLRATLVEFPLALLAMYPASRQAYILV
jgi:hypothetical protein